MWHFKVFSTSFKANTYFGLMFVYICVQVLRSPQKSLSSHVETYQRLNGQLFIAPFDRSSDRLETVERAGSTSTTDPSARLSGESMYNVHFYQPPKLTN